MALTEFAARHFAPSRPVAQKDQKVILAPGRLFASADPATVVATVGSGVAVCVWDDAHHIGGVAHYVLPTAEGWEHAIRCGSGAIPALIQRIANLGGERDRMAAKIFGGARIIASGACAHGQMNVQTALEILSAEKIRIVGADLEGDRARRLMFHVQDGRAWVKRL